ncbi:EamA family transporter [Rhizobium mongolense]|uniref:EamA family transporter n=1 Tax=Rhizobium mongolense TaxID=57676 RepID=UPI0035562E04
MSLLCGGASYPVAKGALFYAPALILILYRFLITTVFMAVVARREIATMSWGDRLRGLAMGTVVFSVSIAETYGVASTSATNTALIISLSLIFTPILDYGLSGRPPPAAYWRALPYQVSVSGGSARSIAVTRLCWALQFCERF